MNGSEDKQQRNSEEELFVSCHKLLPLRSVIVLSQHTHTTHSLTTGLVRDRVSYLPHTPHSVVSTMSWVIGVGIYMVGSVSVNFGTNLAKLSIARNDLLAIEKRRSIVTQPIWIVGRCCEHVVACLGACTDAIGL
jgi:hypothetical protein